MMTHLDCGCVWDQETDKLVVKCGDVGEPLYPRNISLEKTDTPIEGKKFDKGKAPLELLSHQALVEISKVFGYGAEKYGKYNYKAGLSWSRIIGAAYRHLGAFNAGEDVDSETGLSHVAHLGACCIMLLDYIKDHPELDDRFKSSINCSAKPNSS